MQDIDIFTIADIWLGVPPEGHPLAQRSAEQIKRLESEWERRVNKNSIVLLVGGLSWNRGADLVGDLAWFDNLRGVKVMLPAGEEDWGTQQQANKLMEPFSSLIPLISDAVRLPGFSPGHPRCVIAPLVGAPLVDRSGDEFQAHIKQAEQELDHTIRCAKKIRKDRDPFIILTRHAPFADYSNPTSLVSKMDEMKVSCCVYAGMYRPDQWERAWQGRIGKTPATAPDFRLASADFLDFSPTRIGISDHMGWFRKDKERINQITWTFETTANTPERPFIGLNIEYSPQRPEILFSSEIAMAEHEETIPTQTATQLQTAASAARAPHSQDDDQRVSRLMAALAGLPQTLTLHQMEQGHGATFQQWEKELSRLPRSTPLSHITDAMSTVLSSAAHPEAEAPKATFSEEDDHIPPAATAELEESEEEWLETLWLIDGTLTVKQLKKKQNQVYRKFKHHFDNYGKHMTMEEILNVELESSIDVEEMDGAAMIAAATMMRFGFGAIQEGTLEKDTKHKAPKIDVAAAEHAITSLKSENLSAGAFQLRLAKMVEEHLNPK
jgi:predicted phosphohydrolase